jgi:hypothetical protein
VSTFSDPSPRRLPAHAGLKNSSITRVRPFFCRLLDRDPTGESWLPALLDAAPGRNLLPLGVRAQPGPLDPTVRERRPLPVPALNHVISLERCFEYAVPPPTAFLRWLLEHPDKLEWPGKRRGRPKIYGPAAQALRADLHADGEPRQSAAQEKGLAELALQGGAGSRRKWWAFEGFTEVDCALVTDRLLLFIEGKRTEPLASSTDWYPQRNQLVRNLEAVRELAGDRNAAVLLVTETPADGEMSEDVVAAGLPHLNATQRAEVVAGDLGQTTWEQLGKAIGNVLGVPLQPLPETKHDALSQLKLQGRVIRRMA